MSENVLPCDHISDHDAPIAILNIRKQTFEKRYKWIRCEKNLNMSAYINDFKQLPLTIPYVFDDPDEKLEILNDFITECINRHAPLKRVLMTRPPAPWMRDENIKQMQSERDKLRYIAHSTQNENDWNEFRAVRNNLKKVIKSSKKRFYTKALSSKNPKEVWQVIHRILKPSDSRISANPSQLAEYFSSTAPRVTGKDTARNLSSFVDSLKEHDSDHLFTLSQVSSDDILKHISKLRNDCSTGDDTIPTKFIKPVAE